MEEALVRAADRGRRHPLAGRNPVSIFASLLRRPFVYWVPFCPGYDRLYALQLFLRTHKRWPGRYLFNDRLVRMKLDGELLDPVRQALTDKEFVKQYAEGLLGPGCVPKTYAVLSTKQEVFDYEFPRECVVKPCHASGLVHLVRDGVVDRRLVASWLKLDFYRRSREQNHAFLRPKIMVEEFAFGAAYVPDDYKIFCVNGTPKAIATYHDRFKDMIQRFYDIHWNPQPFAGKYRLAEPVPRPAMLVGMLEAAANLSQGLSLARVDFFVDQETFKVGEVTNCPSSANAVFGSPEAEREFSALLFGEEL